MKLEILSDLSNIASTSALRKEVSDMSQFIALYYAKWFLTSSISYSSPRKDLDAIFEMKKYSLIKPEIAKKCLASMRNHGWYLHPSIVPFSLVDPEVPDEEKIDLAKGILQIMSGTSSHVTSKRTSFENIFDMEEKPSISSLVDERSALIFEILNFQEDHLDWLKLPPNLWHHMTAFKILSKFISKYQLGFSFFISICMDSFLC